MESLNFGPKKLGFGCMRFPMTEGTIGGEGVVDTKQVCDMVDTFLDRGFCYFDTAHGYIAGKSESTVRQCLTERYPRDRFLLTDKLSGPFFQTEAEILPLFESQLQATGVAYFDYYLMHALNAKQYEKFTACNAFQVAGRLKQEGRIRHLGMSFHDKPEVLEQILSEHPEIEVVQIQFNYADYEDPTVQSRAVYQVCRKYGKPVIIMEPVKGGALANLPGAAGRILDQLHGGSQASYALRFAASFEGVAMVLSGMSSMEQMRENLDTMSSPQPLTAQEQEALRRACTVFKSQESIACTGCRYCEAGCPMHIQIPDLFAAFNAKKQGAENLTQNYQAITAGDHGKASSCIGCLQCESVCPQQLPVSSLLAQVADTLESCTPEACV